MSTKKPLRAKLASSVSRGAAALSRATGRGDGSVIGGRIGLMIDPNLLANLAAGREIALVSGTNGKTTTTRLTAAAIGVLGDVATNSFGANMPSGHTSALARAGTTPYAVLEVDEHYLPEVLAATHPRVVALLNLSRDQLDRAKEVAMMADLWRRTLATHPVHVVANADDPMVTWAARPAADAGTGVTWVAAGQRWHDDSWVCPECGSHIARATEMMPASDGTETVEAANNTAPADRTASGDADGTATPAEAEAAAATAATIGPAEIAPIGPDAVDPDTDRDALDVDAATVAATVRDGDAVAEAVAAGTGAVELIIAGPAGGPLDEMTVLMPTVPVPDATNPAGRPAGGAHDGAAPMLAPVAAPETVPVSATMLMAPTAPLPNVARSAQMAATGTGEGNGVMIATNHGLIPADLPDELIHMPNGLVGSSGTGALGPDIDDWWCTGCSLRRPTPQWRVAGDAVVDPTGRPHIVELQLPGRVNRANAATALAVAAEFGVDPVLAVPRLAEVASVAGRYAQVQRDGHNIRLLLAKNPAGWLEAFDMAEHAPTLLSINSRDPDGLDTSWLFDVDFTPLRGRTVLITGERAYDLAVRLETDDVPFTYVTSFADALRAAPAGRLEVIANYTAFQDIRAELDRVN